MYVNEFSSLIIFLTSLQGTLTTGCNLLKTFKIGDWWIQYEGVLHFNGFWTDISVHQFLIFKRGEKFLLSNFKQFKTSFSQCATSLVRTLSIKRQARKYVLKIIFIFLKLTNSKKHKKWKVNLLRNPLPTCRIKFSSHAKKSY